MNFEQNPYSSYNDFLISMESGTDVTVISIESPGEMGNEYSKHSDEERCARRSIVGDSDQAELYDMFAVSLIDMPWADQVDDETAKSRRTRNTTKREKRLRGNLSTLGCSPGKGEYDVRELNKRGMALESHLPLDTGIRKDPQFLHSDRTVHVSNQDSKKRQESPASMDQENYRFEKVQEGHQEFEEKNEISREIETSDPDEDGALFPSLFPPMKVNDKSQFMTPNILPLTPSFISK